MAIIEATEARDRSHARGTKRGDMASLIPYHVERDVLPTARIQVY